MNVSTICLAVLFFGDRTGYDIRKISTEEGGFSFFVDASFGSIYPALNRLEAEGQVTCRHEAQNGKPARKVYSITNSGRDHFINELMQPHRADIFRSEFLLISIFARIIGPDAVQAALDRQIGQLTKELAMLDCDETGKEHHERPCPQNGEDELFSDAANWARNCGRYCIQANIDYLRNYGVELVEIAKRGLPPLEQLQAGQ